MSTDLRETNGSAAPPAGADTDALLARLLDRVEAIGRGVERLERAGGQVPALAGLALDAFDDACRRAADAGTDVDARAGRLLGLAGRLADDATLDALEALVARLPQLSSLAKQLDALPGLLGMLGDILDEWAGNLAAQGIDVETAVRQGLHAALWLGQRVSETELDRLGILIRSDVLEPHALAVVGKTGRALATCHEGACATTGPGRVGPLGALRALRDPDVQRSLGFLIQFARLFGGHLGEPADIPTTPTR
jgi:hypothetical protein